MFGGDLERRCGGGIFGSWAAQVDVCVSWLKRCEVFGVQRCEF